MNSLARIFFFALLWIILSGHEFWLEPRRFHYQPGEEILLNFKVGENFVGEPWDLKNNKIEKLELYRQQGATNLTLSVKPDDRDKLKIKSEGEGTYLFALQSNNGFLEMEAAKFNDYLSEDGLENVIQIRTRTNTLDKPAKEFYCRYAKVLVQVGSKTDDTYKKVAGHRLEIMTEQNPYAVKPDDYFQVTILYEGKPLPHQMVKVWNKIGNLSFLQDLYTENDGKLKFPLSSKGMWMVSAVKMIAAENAAADWQSMRSSLVFEIM